MFGQPVFILKSSESSNLSVEDMEQGEREGVGSEYNTTQYLI